MIAWLSITVMLAPWLDTQPPVEDLLRFPSQAVCEQQLEANILHWGYLCARLGMERHNHAALSEWKRESNQLFYDWLALKHAHQANNRPGGSVRVQLGRLRDRIGFDAYYEGRMPPCMPLWRFTIR